MAETSRLLARIVNENDHSKNKNAVAVIVSGPYILPVHFNVSDRAHEQQELSLIPAAFLEILDLCRFAKLSVNVDLD
jgi:hypothetical protein